ncbi:hypothetical protein TNCV_3589201 [Trichonephila clavipes]|nr:hypothetical protein TNCV_3589201 [Trichonephila clavipes]
MLSSVKENKQIRTKARCGKKNYFQQEQIIRANETIKSTLCLFASILLPFSCEKDHAHVIAITRSETGIDKRSIFDTLSDHEMLRLEKRKVHYHFFKVYSSKSFSHEFHSRVLIFETAFSHLQGGRQNIIILVVYSRNKTSLGTVVTGVTKRK